MSNNRLFNRLHAAALRVIAANSIGVVGRDGRWRVVLESVHAEIDLATILRELGEIPKHTDDCAACGRLPALCDCEVSKRIAQIMDEP